MAKAQSALPLFTEALDHLKGAADCLKLASLQDWPCANTSTTLPQPEVDAARSVAAEAVEVAREALLLCARLERPSNMRDN